MTKELEDKIVSEGAAAIAAHMDAMKSEFKSSDALNKETMKKAAEQIADTIEQLQSLKLKAESIEKQNKDLEAAIARTGTKDSQVDTVKQAQSEMMETFIRKGSAYGHSAGVTVELNAFAKEFAEKKGIELKALSVNSNVDGGFLVLPYFSGVVQTQVFETSPIRLFADSETISTDSLEFVDDYDEADAEWAAETATRATTGTPQFAKRNIPTHEIYAKPKMSQKIIEDSVVNVESWLASKLADKFSRKENTAFVSGTGVGQPKGFTQYAAGSSTYTQGAIEQINSGDAGTYTYNGLVNAMAALKTEYMSNAIWACNRNSLAELLQVKDGENRPIFNMVYDKNTKTFGSMLGLRLAQFQDMPAPTAGLLALALGDFRKGYKIVDRVGISILRDPYSAKPFVEFYARKRVGGDVANFEAIKLVKISS
jgi:HK97 family phage major capsid protein